MGGTPKITLILGGARSGKSSLAEKLAHKRAKTEAGVLYVATLQPFDDEMQARVIRHRAARPSTWRTVEASYNLIEPVFSALEKETVILLDCLTVWTSNLLLRESGEDSDETRQPDYEKLELMIMAELESLITQVREHQIGLIMVSNEVGLGLVPPYPLGRVYRDLLGRVNQRLASWADEVFMVFAGLPVNLKKLTDALTTEDAEGFN